MAKTQSVINYVKTLKRVSYCVSFTEICHSAPANSILQYKNAKSEIVGVMNEVTRSLQSTPILKAMHRFKVLLLEILNTMFGPLRIDTSVILKDFL